MKPRARDMVFIPALGNTMSASGTLNRGGETVR
jgi:hypothetical protein